MATTVRRVWAGITARLAEPGTYLPVPALPMVKSDHMVRREADRHWSKVTIVYIFGQGDPDLLFTHHALLRLT